MGLKYVQVNDAFGNKLHGKNVQQFHVKCILVRRTHSLTQIILLWGKKIKFSVYFQVSGKEDILLTLLLSLYYPGSAQGVIYDLNLLSLSNKVGKVI